MKKICFINGSLMGKKSSSLVFLNDLQKLFPKSEYEKEFIAVKSKIKEGYPEDAIKKIAAADAVLMAFPLYSYCLPGGLMRLLEEYYHYAKNNPYNKNARVYAIVNCGFVLPETNTEAIRVMKNFCQRLSINWRFAVAIGCGPAVIMTKFIDLKLRRTFKNILLDSRSDDLDQKDNVFIKPILPRIIMDTVRQHLDRNALKKMNKEK